MGYEGFSKSWRAPKMHPIVGNRGEFLFLALLFPTLLMLKATREKNEAEERKLEALQDDVSRVLPGHTSRESYL